MTDPKVSFAETLAIKVGRFLRKEYPNIALANSDGMSIDKLSTSLMGMIGLLDANSAPQLSWWWKIFRRPRRRFMGVLKVSTNDCWLIEVYGDQDIEFLTGLAERLAKEFHTSIHLRLVSEKLRRERLQSDSIA